MDHLTPIGTPVLKRVAIHQPNYLPWIGYFHKIALVDEFVFLDDIQLPLGKSFCSRVKVLGTNGPTWLTVPVEKGEDVLIKDARIVDGRWKQKHMRTIELSYKKSPNFARCWSALAPLIEEAGDSLADLNIALIERVSGLLGLSVKFMRSSSLHLDGIGGDEKILELLKILGAATYVTGEGAGSKRYVNRETFDKTGITLELQGFVHPVYDQRTGNFEPFLSIIDFLFNADSDYFAEVRVEIEKRHVLR